MSVSLQSVNYIFPLFLNLPLDTVSFGKLEATVIAQRLITSIIDIAAISFGLVIFESTIFGMSFSM